MEDLSRKLGITKSAIYHHVPQQGRAAAAGADRALDGLFAEVAREAEGTPGPAIDRLERLVRGSVAVLADRAAVRHPAAARARQHQGRA